MVLVVSKKSRTFSSLPYSANEQVRRSWEGAQPGSQPKLASGNIPYHGHHAQFIKGVGWGTGILFFNSLSEEFEYSLVRAFKLFWKFSLFLEFHEIHEICQFQVPRLLLRDWL